jgi:hypothetical protein
MQQSNLGTEQSLSTSNFKRSVSDSRVNNGSQSSRAKPFDKLLVEYRKFKRGIHGNKDMNEPSTEQVPQRKQQSSLSRRRNQK